MMRHERQGELPQEVRVALQELLQQFMAAKSEVDAQNAVKAIDRQIGWGDNGLADLVGWTRSTVAEWRGGRRMPRDRTLEPLRAILREGQVRERSVAPSELGVLSWAELLDYSRDTNVSRAWYWIADKLMGDADTEFRNKTKRLLKEHAFTMIHLFPPGTEAENSFSKLRDTLKREEETGERVEAKLLGVRIHIGPDACQHMFLRGMRCLLLEWDQEDSLGHSHEGFVSVRLTEQAMTVYASAKGIPKPHEVLLRVDWTVAGEWWAECETIAPLLKSVDKYSIIAFPPSATSTESQVAQQSERSK